MKKTWLLHLANEVEARHGKDKRDRVFGDIKGIRNEHTSIARWFSDFTRGLDELDDKEFLTAMLVKNCPCGKTKRAERGKAIKKLYDDSSSLQEFVDLLEFEEFRGCADYGYEKELRGNILYLTRRLARNTNVGNCGMGCHCALARHADASVSNIYCHCCTVGYSGWPFRVAFGDDIKIEFVESLISGGKRCVIAVHLPSKP